MTVSPPSRAHVLSRIAASLLGSYLFVSGFMCFGICLAVAAGMRYAQAQELLSLSAFLVFVGCFIAAFALRSLARVWGLLVGLGAAMLGAGWLLSRALL